jgi:hypothetical protein
LPNPEGGEEPPLIIRRYWIVERPDRHPAVDAARLTTLLAKDGQL